jgi:hypothetical protein
VFALPLQRRRGSDAERSGFRELVERREIDVRDPVAGPVIARIVARKETCDRNPALGEGSVIRPPL